EVRPRSSPMLRRWRLEEKYVMPLRVVPDCPPGSGARFVLDEVLRFDLRQGPPEVVDLEEHYRLVGRRVWLRSPFLKTQKHFAGLELGVMVRRLLGKSQAEYLGV